MRPALDLITVAVALGLGVLLYPPLIRRLAAMKAGQVIQAELPAAHQRKAGTPTGGGVLFVAVGLLGAILATAAGHRGTLPLAGALVVGGLIGLSDDLSKLRRGSIGIPARAKFPIQVLLAIPVAGLCLQAGGGQQLPWGGDLPAVVYWPLAVLALVGTANAVNLTDGLDGLAGVVSVVCLVGLLEFLPGTLPGEKAGGLALLGAIVAFLVFNRHPARVFMGDAGALAIGYAVAAMAIQQHLLLILPLIGLMLVMEAASVIIQVASFKATRRRVFRMAPIHYTFQLAGWSENRITLTFGLGGLVAALVAVWVVHSWA